jgi:uncharacterized protein (DUF4213/DUF364 family)
MKWSIYNELIEQVPDDRIVESCVVGLHWIAVRSHDGVGMAMTPLEGATRFARAGRVAGMPLKELAQGIKSWNNLEAAIGLAAVNAALNAPDVVEKTLAQGYTATYGVNVFDRLLEEVHGKKVAVIGHFRNLESLAAVCDLSILERRIVPGDLPDPACEYVLPEQDVVIITATTLINKTLPRLLELSGHARVVLTGPSTPMSPLLFDRGVETLGGLVVDDAEGTMQLIQEGGHHEFFDRGTRMCVTERVPLEARV